MTKTCAKLAAFLVAHAGELYLVDTVIFLAVSAAVPPINDYRAYLQWWAIAHGHR